MASRTCLASSSSLCVGISSSFVNLCTSCIKFRAKMIWYFTFDASMQMMVQESDAAAAAAVTVLSQPRHMRAAAATFVR